MYLTKHRAQYINIQGDVFSMISISMTLSAININSDGLCRIAKNHLEIKMYSQLKYTSLFLFVYLTFHIHLFSPMLLN